VVGLEAAILNEWDEAPKSLS